ncbi:HisA/HisF-related TIM barrel protein [Candidatus Margulisiibacteriota bacterium]
MDGAKTGKLVNLPVFQKIRKAVACKLDLGGGIRTIKSVETLLDIGIDYIVLGSILVKNTEIAFNIIEQFPNKIIAGLDLKDNAIAIEGWLEKSKVSLEVILKELEKRQIHSIIYTDVARDGMLTGPNLEGLKHMTSLTNIPIIASGGISSYQDIENVRKLEKSGVYGVITGKALLEGQIDILKLF